MPDEVSTEASATPVPVDTQSAPITGGLTPPPAAAPPPQSQVQQGPPPKAPPGQFFSSLSHAFTGALLGTMAGREKTTGYQTDDTGKQTPITSQKTSGDQLRDIARSALLGLAAGSRIGPQKSGMGAALAGLGAGAEDAVDRSKQTDLLQRKQSTEEFERGQQAMLSKATNAHIAIETMKTINELRNSTLDTQSKFASLGQDQADAAIAGGNTVPLANVHMDEIMQAKKDHPDWMNFTPILTKATPKEGADPNDPNAVDRFYSLVDLTKPVKMTPAMIGHLKAVGFPGADSLSPDQPVDPKTFQATWYNGLKMYNNALLDPKNKDVIDVTSADGTPMKAVYNKTLNTTEILRDPDTGKPLGGKIETMSSRIKGADGKTYDVLQNKANGKTIKVLGEAGTAADNQGLQTFGDYSKSGDAYLSTVEQPIRNDIKAIGDYNMEPAALGRGGATRPGIMSGVLQYRPTFQEATYKERYDYLKGYQNSVTGDGAARSRINTALGHLDLLGQAVDGVAKNDLTALNKLANEYGIQTDQPGPVLYNLVADKAAAEFAASTGNSNDTEIATGRKNLRLDAGPIQQRQQIVGNMRLLKTQADTIENNFKQAMGASSDELQRPVIYQQNKPILDKWTSGPVGGQGGPPRPANAAPNAVYSKTGPHGPGWYDPALFPGVK